MPYIKSSQRSLLDPSVAELAHAIAYVSKKIEADSGNQQLSVLPGLTNYAVTALMLTIIDGNESYATYNAIIGVLESVKLEFYRQHVAPYEVQKEFENGEVTAVRAQ